MTSIVFKTKDSLSFNIMQLRKICLIYCCILTIYNTVSLVNGAVTRNDTTNKALGIKFHLGFWSEVLAEAKHQQKPIFLDIYTTWCGPCKLMAKQTFSNAKVGEIINKKFISYHLDAEKGEGIQLAKIYSVNVFPTSLYITADGSLIHRSVGYIDTKKFLEESDKAYSKLNDPNTLILLEKQFKEGKHDIDFLKKYLSKLNTNKKSDGEALDLYLRLIPVENWQLKENLELIINNTTDFNSLAYEFLLKQTPLLIKSYDKEIRDLGLGARIQQFQIINNTLEKAINIQNEVLLEECIIQELKIYSTMANQTPKDQDKFSNEKRLYFYSKTKQIVKYKPLALLEANYLVALSIDSIKAKDIESYKLFLQNTASVSDIKKQNQAFKKQAERMQNMESSRIANKLNSIAKVFCENLADSSDLSLALTWSMRSLEYNKVSTYLETAASLLNKLGRKAEAASFLNEAIVLEKENGQDTTRFVKILNELNK